MYLISVLSITLLCSSFIVPIFFQLGLALGLCNFIIKVSYNKGKASLTPLKIIGVALLLMIPSVLYHSPTGYNLKYAIIVILAMLNSYVIASHSPKHNSLLAWLPLLVLILLLIGKLNMGYTVDTVMPDNSSNYISISLFGAYLSYFLLSKNFNISSVHLLLLIVITALCIVAQGRAGTILSFLLLLSGVFTLIAPRFKKYSKSVKWLVGGTVVGLSVGGILVIGYYLYMSGLMGKLAERGLYNAPRLFLMLEYIESGQVENLFLGLNVFEYPALGRYGFNLHNNYFYLHSLYGLFFTLFYIGMLTYTVRWFWKKGYRHVSIAFLIVIARAFTDTQVFSGRFDYLFLGMFLFCFYFSSQYLVNQTQLKAYLQVEG